MMANGSTAKAGTLSPKKMCEEWITGTFIFELKEGKLNPSDIRRACRAAFDYELGQDTTGLRSEKPHEFHCRVREKAKSKVRTMLDKEQKPEAAK